jgi:hypothetical protein
MGKKMSLELFLLQCGSKFILTTKWPIMILFVHREEIRLARYFERNRDKKFKWKGIGKDDIIMRSNVVQCLKVINGNATRNI